ncbi:hypothetical protein VNO77_12588 [Canavalia gladiata]|uniref:Protein FAR1-RELATED SEQUENCE n=1 Tax=Canavalia gladiata TaxID=3824 RepID=A0AAN9QQ31_CANGL
MLESASLQISNIRAYHVKLFYHTWSVTGYDPELNTKVWRRWEVALGTEMEAHSSCSNSSAQWGGSLQACRASTAPFFISSLRSRALALNSNLNFTPQRLSSPLLHFSFLLLVRFLMDRDGDELGPQTSNDLDLNVEQNCCSPNIVHANDSQSVSPSTNVLSTNTLLGIGTEFESDDHAYRFYNKYARLVDVDDKHACDIYTPRAFEVFQQGYEKSLNVLVNQHSRNGLLFEYKANTFGHTRQYSVSFDSSVDTVVCSCLKFEHVGFLCSHALRVLDHRNIKVVPSQYISKRWARDARLGNHREIRQCKMQDNPKMAIANCYKDLCHRLLKLSARASESVEAYEFASRQLDEVMEGVEKILTLRVEEGQVISSSGIDANASESEPGEIFLNGHAAEDQDESDEANGEKDRRATSDRGHLTTMTCNGINSLNVEVSPPNSVVCISSPSSAYVSSQSTTPNPILQGLYSFEANQVVHCMYEQPNLVLDHQSNTNMFQPPNFFSNQQDSPGQSQLMQEPIIQNTYHESMPSNNQMRQGMDLDIQNPHSSSFLLYDHRYRNSDSA